MIPTVGIDPGGKHVGIVLRGGKRGDHLYTAEVLTRRDGTGDDHLTIKPWVTAVVNLVEDYLHSAAEVAGVTSVQAALADGQIRLAVEGMVKPTGFRRGGGRAPIQPGSLIGPAIVLGGVLAVWPDAVVVRPGGHGAAPDRSYPEAIRKGSRIGGPTVHAHSAWDIAGAADPQVKLAKALGA